MRFVTRRAMLAFTALVALAALVPAGCGGDDGEQAGGEGRQAFKGTTLRLLLKEGYEIEAIKSFKGDFEKATGIQVKLEVYDEPTARQKFVLDATSQTGTYDITSASFWNLPEFVKAGWLEPLDGYMTDKRDPWLDPESLPEGAVNAMKVDDKLYAIPHTIISGMFFYRKDILREHGIEPPQTTDDILAAAKELKAAGVVPFSGRGAATFASLGSELGWAYGYGAMLFDDQDRPQADSPEMKQAMNDYVTLMRDYGPSDAASLTFTQAGEKFSSGQAAMMFDTSGFGTIFENPEQSKVAGKVGFTLPTGPAGNTLQWLYNEGLAISAASKQKDAAWLFLQWRVSEETTMRELLEGGRTDVPNLAVLESAEYERYAEREGLTDFTTILPESWNSAVTEHWPFYPEFAQIGDTFCAEISSAIAGSQSVDEALENAQAKLTDIMQRAGYF